MGGFNTQVFLNLARAVGAAPPTWDDQLHVAAAVVVTSIAGIGSDGPAGRAGWAEDRTIAVWKCQGSNNNFGTGLTLVLKLYDATAGTTIYSASFGSLLATASASLSGAPLATYTLLAGHTVKATDNGSVNTASAGGGFLFSAISLGTPLLAFDSQANLACDVLYASANGYWGAAAHNAVIASYVGVRSIKLYKVIWANGSQDLNVAPVGVTRAYSFKLYNATAGVTIYNAVNVGVLANSTSFLTGDPLTNYSLPSGDILSIDLTSTVLPTVTFERLAIAMGFIAE